MSKDFLMKSCIDLNLHLNLWLFLAVELNDQGYQPNSGVTFKDGCPVSVLIKLHNQSGN